MRRLQNKANRERATADTKTSSTKHVQYEIECSVGWEEVSREAKKKEEVKGKQKSRKKESVSGEVLKVGKNNI